jgi:type IV fimbrial biogenesis protein FimT
VDAFTARQILTPDRSESGFSLIELLVVLVLLGVLTAVAGPTLRRQRVMNDALNEMRAMRALNDTARFEALRRHSQMGVIYSSGGRTVTVFEDRDRNDDSAAGNGNGQLDSGEVVLTQHHVDDTMTFSRPGGGNVVDLSGTTLLYRSDGSLRAPAVTVPAVYFSDAFGNNFRIRVNRMTGASRIEMYLGDSKWSTRREQWTWSY